MKWSQRHTVAAALLALLVVGASLIFLPGRTAQVVVQPKSTVKESPRLEPSPQRHGEAPQRDLVGTGESAVVPEVMPKPSAEQVAQATELASDLRAVINTTSARVQATLNEAGNYKGALSAEVFSLKKLVRPLAFAQGLADPALRPQLARLLQNPRCYEEIHNSVAAIVDSAKLSHFLYERSRPEEFEKLLVQSQAALKDEYRDLVNKMQLPDALVQDAELMFGNTAIFEMITYDMRLRGFDWNAKTSRYEPKNEKSHR